MTKRFSLRGIEGAKQIPFLNLQHWNFLFLIGVLLAALSLRKLRNVSENGEINKTVLVKEMKNRFKISVSEGLNTPVFKIISSPVLVPAMATLNMLRYVEANDQYVEGLTYSNGQNHFPFQ
jgi:uncharacterized protein YlxP (DUF503 family)